MVLVWHNSALVEQEKLDDTKRVIRSRKSKTDRQYNGQKKNDKMTNNGLKIHTEN